MSGGTPYIGSKISLLSKSDIRYMGTLYSIDTEESTVTLANVRSFGTENRKVERKVPASKEVYEYIVFRGSDIKDLHVSEPPKTQSQPTPQLPQDPAIVQSSSQAMRSGYSPFPTPNPYGTNSYVPFGGIPAYYPLGMQQSPFLTSPGAGQAPIHQRIPTPPMIDPMRVRTPTPPPEIPPIGVSPSSQSKTQETQTKDQKAQGTQTSKRSHPLGETH